MNSSADFALERGLPMNLEAERLLLGSCIIDDDAFGLIRGSLERDDFALEKHRRLWAGMQALYEAGQRIDRVALASEMMKRGQLESVDGITYISNLDEGMPVIANLEGYARIVSEKSILRRGAFACKTLLDRFLVAEEEPGELLASAESLIRELNARSASKGNLESAAKIVGDMDINQIGRQPKGAVYSPYPTLNRSVAGFREGELVVIGARPSAGKSTMVVEMALRAARDQQTVAMFSLEMRKHAVIHRAACNLGQVDNARLRHGRLSDVERADFMRALTDVAGMPIHIDDRAHTFSAMVREVRKMQPKPRVVIVDHLHLMRSIGRSENRNNELAAITREMKLFAGEMSVTVILLAQLSRASEKENRPPEMRDLRDCGSIEADADLILFLHRRDTVTTEAERPERVPVDLLLAKQREGIAFVKVPLQLIGKYYRFEEIAQYQETQ